ncbi:uncharacterized protein Dvar_08190 [Desulfosarcina variabilis str. Montpellier]
MMNKNIRPIFLLDKTKTLAVIEPFHDTTCHTKVLLKKIKKCFKLKVLYRQLDKPLIGNKAANTGGPL